MRRPVRRHVKKCIRYVLVCAAFVYALKTILGSEKTPEKRYSSEKISERRYSSEITHVKRYSSEKTSERRYSSEITHVRTYSSEKIHVKRYSTEKTNERRYNTVSLNENDVRQIGNLSRDVSWIDNYLDLAQAAPEFTEPEISNRSMTIVSAFFDMGTFQKGNEVKQRNSSIYIEWSHPYRYMNNPMVIFTDTEIFKREMLKMRENHLSRTIVILIPKKRIWSYRLIPWIKKIISYPDYPKYHPNTVVPEYSSAMFAKTELVEYVAKKNFFSTNYFCWIDIGYYRNILHRRKPFWLEVPSTFDRRRVALTGVFKVDLDNTPVKQVFLEKMDWLAGGLQIYTSDVAVHFNRQFQNALVRYLAKGYLNSDQQVIFSMNTRTERTKYPLDVELQLFYQTNSTKSKIDPDSWFHLGYLMYRENDDQLSPDKM